MGGKDHLRLLWRHAYTGTQGIIFVVDSCDRERIAVAAAELQNLVIDDQLAVRAAIRVVQPLLGRHAVFDVAARVSYTRSCA